MRSIVLSTVIIDDDAGSTRERASDAIHAICMMCARR